MKYILSTPVLLLLYSFSFPTIETEITGYLRSHSYKNVNNIVLLVKEDGLIIGKTITDKKGNFTLHFDVGSTPEQYYYVNKHDTLAIKDFKWIDDKDGFDETRKAVFYIP